MVQTFERAQRALYQKLEKSNYEWMVQLANAPTATEARKIADAIEWLIQKYNRSKFYELKWAAQDLIISTLRVLEHRVAVAKAGYEKRQRAKRIATVQAIEETI